MSKRQPTIRTKALAFGGKVKVTILPQDYTEGPALTIDYQSEGRVVSSFALYSTEARTLAKLLTLMSDEAEARYSESKAK